MPVFTAFGFRDANSFGDCAPEESSVNLKQPTPLNQPILPKLLSTPFLVSAIYSPPKSSGAASLLNFQSPLSTIVEPYNETLINFAHSFAIRLGSGSDRAVLRTDSIQLPVRKRGGETLLRRELDPVRPNALLLHWTLVPDVEAQRYLATNRAG
jgi:hypothetical protein